MGVSIDIPADRLLLAPLFAPFSVGSLTVPNRLVMSPMTREMSPNNLLNEAAPDYYGRRARGGCGLVVTEGAAVPHPVAHQNSRIPNFSGDSLQRWAAVAGRVHAEGGGIFAQLWHTGLYRDQEGSANPAELSIAPSVVGRTPVRAMSDTDIAEVIAAFAQAAADARRIGFDGIEIHGAHGYLPDQFLWAATNRRTDGYGGSLENRVRFPVELVKAVRAATAPDFPIMFRFSQWKGVRYDVRIADTPQELEALLVPLADAGVDIFDASTRRFWTAEFEDSDLNLAGWAKKITGKASMTVGSVGLESPLEVGKISTGKEVEVSMASLGRLLEMLDRGDFDLVGLGRIVLTNPDWPKLVRDGRLDLIRPYDATAVAERLECAAP